MSALLKNPSQGILTRENINKAIWNTLKTSIFPGAKDDSILMAIDYCNANNLDILQKPVHIVQMNVKDSKTGKYEWRDVIMNGIGFYRTKAERTGLFAGMSEEIYGPEITEELDGVTISYPKWCKITVKKIVGNSIVDFTATVFWKEAYATRGKDSTAPNAQWFKRPYGQVGKCTEAAALRKGFSDTIGSLPTAEEMEGKTIEHESELLAPVKNKNPEKGIQGVRQVLGIDKVKEPESQHSIEHQTRFYSEPVLASKDEIDDFLMLIENYKIPRGVIDEGLKKKSYASLEELTKEECQQWIDHLFNKYVNKE